MAGLAEPITSFALRQELEFFGDSCILVVEGGQLSDPAGRLGGRMRVYQVGHELPEKVLADVHLPAPIHLAMLNALYASYLTLPLAQIGRELQGRAA